MDPILLAVKEIVTALVDTISTPTKVSRGQSKGTLANMKVVLPSEPNANIVGTDAGAIEAAQSINVGVPTAYTSLIAPPAVVESTREGCVY